ncbi:MAG: (d)CMP kinase [Anaerolineaceae bacterium]|nr:(d)CMP kinase [Anaerolineaceae bacterium]
MTGAAATNRVRAQPAQGAKKGRKKDPEINQRSGKKDVRKRGKEKSASSAFICVPFTSANRPRGNVLVKKQISLIAIDGPAASGKSTVGRLLAEKLHFLYLDTGCMYRAITWAALQRGIDVADETAVTQLARNIQIDIYPARGEADGRHYTVHVDGQDITWGLRTPAVDANVSQVSSYLGVRREMVKRQRAFGQRGAVVMVGRDIGTVVMPEAPLKLYITASSAERARRRTHDRQAQGHTADYGDILADVQRRDEIDSNREHSPLRPAADAILIDSTDRSPVEIVDAIFQMLKEPVNGNR